MTKVNLAALFTSAALLLVTVGCGEPDRVENANVRTTSNANVAVVNSNTTATVDKDEDWDPDMTRDDFDKNKEKYEREAKEAGSTVGQGANDLWLWTKTRAALAAADDLRDSTINVDVDNDVVTLKGSVSSAAQKTRAEQIAKAIEGVKNVRNQLTATAAGAANTNARG